MIRARLQGRIFGLEDWEKWLDDNAQKLFGISGPQFERLYLSGVIRNEGTASDLASPLGLIHRLRQRALIQQVMES